MHFERKEFNSFNITLLFKITCTSHPKSDQETYE